METGVITLPPGLTSIDEEIRLRPNAHDIEIVGSGDSVLRASDKFQGRSLILAQNAKNIRFRNFSIDGNRAISERPLDLPPAASPLMGHFSGHGLSFDECSGVTISNVSFREVAGFAIVASRTKGITVEKVTVADSGSKNARGRNNTTGGILLEEGTDDFEVRDSTFRRILGNAVWTHSTFRSPRNYRGKVSGNTFDVIGRDAVQIGHANRVRVENNRGKFIGFPHNVVDLEGQGWAVGIDTAGKFDEGVYANNSFEEINGKCIDLDGFHDGQVVGNTCLNRGAASEYPYGNYFLVMNNTFAEMKSQLIRIENNVFEGGKYGALFVIGEGHHIAGNKFRRLNMAQCGQSTCDPVPNQPGLLEAGIYLAYKAERVSPSRGNIIENNEIQGFGMAKNCVTNGPSVNTADNQVRGNRCTGE